MGPRWARSLVSDENECRSLAAASHKYLLAGASAGQSNAREQCAQSSQKVVLLLNVVMSCPSPDEHTQLGC